MNKLSDLFFENYKLFWFLSLMTIPSILYFEQYSLPFYLTIFIQVIIGLISLNRIVVLQKENTN